MPELPEHFFTKHPDGPAGVTPEWKARVDKLAMDDGWLRQHVPSPGPHAWGEKDYFHSQGWGNAAQKFDPTESEETALMHSAMRRRGQLQVSGHAHYLHGEHPNGVNFATALNAIDTPLDYRTDLQKLAINRVGQTFLDGEDYKHPSGEGLSPSGGHVRLHSIAAHYIKQIGAGYGIPVYPFLPGNNLRHEVNLHRDTIHSIADSKHWEPIKSLDFTFKPDDQYGGNYNVKGHKVQINMAHYHAHSGETNDDARRRLRKTVAHEMGHAEHARTNPEKFHRNLTAVWPYAQTKYRWNTYLQGGDDHGDRVRGKNLHAQIHQEVSPYAASHPLELVAEMFHQMTDGRKFKPNLLDLFDEAGGAYPKGTSRGSYESHQYEPEPFYVSSAQGWLAALHAVRSDEQDPTAHSLWPSIRQRLASGVSPIGLQVKDMPKSRMRELQRRALRRALEDGSIDEGTANFVRENFPDFGVIGKAAAIMPEWMVKASLPFSYPPNHPEHPAHELKSAGIDLTNTTANHMEFGFGERPPIMGNQFIHPDGKVTNHLLLHPEETKETKDVGALVAEAGGDPDSVKIVPGADQYSGYHHLTFDQMSAPGDSSPVTATKVGRGDFKDGMKQLLQGYAQGLTWPVNVARHAFGLTSKKPQDLKTMLGGASPKPKPSKPWESFATFEEVPRTKDTPAPGAIPSIEELEASMPSLDDIAPEHAPKLGHFPGRKPRRSGPKMKADDPVKVGLYVLDHDALKTHRVRYKLTGAAEVHPDAAQELLRKYDNPYVHAAIMGGPGAVSKAIEDDGVPWHPDWDWVDLPGHLDFRKADRVKKITGIARGIHDTAILSDGKRRWFIKDYGKYADAKNHHLGTRVMKSLGFDVPDSYHLLSGNQVVSEYSPHPSVKESSETPYDEIPEWTKKYNARIIAARYLMGDYDLHHGKWQKTPEHTLVPIDLDYAGFRTFYDGAAKQHVNNIGLHMGIDQEQLDEAFDEMHPKVKDAVLKHMGEFYPHVDRMYDSWKDGTLPPPSSTILHKSGPVSFEPWANQNHSYSDVTEMVPTDLAWGFREFDRAPGDEHAQASPEYWQKLRDDIKENGIKSPLIMGWHPGSGTAKLIEGNHRLAIARELGLTHVPVRMARYNDGLSTNGHPPRPIPGHRIGSLTNQFGYTMGDLPPSAVFYQSDEKAQSHIFGKSVKHPDHLPRMGPSGTYEGTLVDVKHVIPHQPRNYVNIGPVKRQMMKVPLDKVVTSQPYLVYEHLKNHFDGTARPAYPVAMTHVDGKFSVNDGNHRVAAAILRGDTHIDAAVNMGATAHPEVE